MPYRDAVAASSHDADKVRASRLGRASLLPLIALALLLPALGLGLFLTAVRDGSPALVAEVSSQRPDVLPLAVGLDEPLPAPDAATTSGKSAERWSNDRIYMVEPRAWSADTRAMIDEALALLPASVRGQLGNPALGPMYISVNREGRTLSGQQPYRRAANFYSTNEGINEIVLFPEQSSRTVLHELGHAYNLRNIEAGSYARVFLEPEMKSFMAAAQWQVLTPDSEIANLRDHAGVRVRYDGTDIWSRMSREDPLEDYANSFALYFSSPAELARLSPARHAWFLEWFGE